MTTEVHKQSSSFVTPAIVALQKCASIISKADKKNKNDILPFFGWRGSIFLTRLHLFKYTVQ